MATVNPWKKFEQLLPQSTSYRAQVLSVENNGQVLIDRNGSHLKVRTQISVATEDRVLVVDGTITQTLPDLPYARIEI